MKKLAIALALLPRVFLVLHRLLTQIYSMPHVVAARSRGLSRMRILGAHVIPLASGEIMALGGATVSLAIGCSIPVESLLGIPGLGQLAWQAALGRDLSLLIAITALVTAVTLTANTTAELLGESLRVRA